MKCVVHIGTEKTGTTSLQAFFAANADILAERGLAYSAAFDRTNNRKIATIAVGPDRRDESFVQYELDTPEDYAAFKEQVLADFDAEIAALTERGGIDTYFISNEHLHSRVRTPDMVGEVAAVLRRHFSQIEIVCFLRPQADLALSRLSTAARNGKRVDTAAYMTDGLFFDYLALHERWAGHFGTVRMVPYKRHRDTIGWFLDHFGLDPEGLTTPEGLNTALDYRSIQMLGLSGPRVLNGRFNRNRQIFLKEHPLEEPLSVDRDLARRRQEMNRETNEALCALDGGLTMEDLTPDYDRYPEQGNMRHLDAEFPVGPRVTWLISRFNAELALERAQTRIAEAELAMAGSEWAQAAGLLKAARTQVTLAAETGLEAPVRRARWMGKKVEKLGRRLRRASRDE